MTPTPTVLGGVDLVHPLVHSPRMSRVVNVHEAKTHFSRLLDRAAAGEEIVLAKAGKPVARLVPLASRGARRVPGSAKGIIVLRKNFDAPLPRSIRRHFE
jgi:prevent-host-death family protein